MYMGKAICEVLRARGSQIRDRCLRKDADREVHMQMVGYMTHFALAKRVGLR